MNIYPIQQSIVTKLQADFIAASTPFVAKDLPDSDIDYDSGLKAPVVYVVYSGSQADLSDSTNVVAQRRKLRFNLELHARSLYKANGLFIARDIIEQSVVGYKPLNCQRLYLIKDDITKDKDTNIWIHVFEFECVTMLVQKEETDPIVVPSFTEIVDEE